MASSSGKPTAVHFSLIFFVMTTIIAGVVAYLMFRDYEEAQARYDKASDDLKKSTQVALDRDDAIQAMKGILGINYAEIGDTKTPNTVMYAIAQDVLSQGGYPPGTDPIPTVHNAFAEMRTKLDQLQREHDQVVAKLRGRDLEFANLEARQQERVNAALQAQAGAEKLRDDVQNTQKERLDAADKLYQDKVAEFAAARAEWEQDKTQLENQIVALKQENKDLIIVNGRVQEKLDGLQKVSFEVADGEIRWVDHNSRLVWINVGSDDLLTKRTTFSVYTKSHSGIGRGAEDIKASIEVTRLIGPHLAEARILDSNIYEPMAPGDPIYTPLWSPGRSESFAIVGFIDVDGDGRSDRELVTEHIAAAGARFDTEVLDDGTRLGKKIDVTTKFFVVADLPDPSLTSDEDEKKLYGTILEHFSDMQKEARQQGVRKISLSDFLAYIGYRPSRRLFRPGEGTPYKLKSGAASTATNQTLGTRKSSGQTAGVYSRSKRLKQPSSSGQTSKLFGGNRGYDR